jgi:hypothetical protein
VNELRIATTEIMAFYDRERSFINMIVILPNAIIACTGIISHEVATLHNHNEVTLYLTSQGPVWTENALLEARSRVL